MNGSRGGGREGIGGCEVLWGALFNPLHFALFRLPFFFFLTLVALGLYFACQASIRESPTPARTGLLQQSRTPPPVGAFSS